MLKEKTTNCAMRHYLNRAVKKSFLPPLIPLTLSKKCKRLIDCYCFIPPDLLPIGLNLPSFSQLDINPDSAPSSSSEPSSSEKMKSMTRMGVLSEVSEVYLMLATVTQTLPIRPREFIL